MKTQSQWLQMLSKCGTGHPAACCCDRCKKGVETVLLESDIAEIQSDAREGMVPESDFQPLIDCVMLYDSGGIAEELATLRAKHPNLFTK